jgi:two-component system phosphate regulon sensor histidine kinase PhoR
LLFKNIAYTSPYELVVFINNSDAVISKSLGGALLASFSIIILLAAAFTYFVRTLLRQKKLSEMKTDFINNMTHEFMTPVTNIGLAIETLQKGNKTPGDETKILEVIATENVHLQDNINKVLQVAVLERGSFLLNTTEVNIHEMLTRVARNFNMQLEAKEGKFVFNMNASNPVIDADETHIINLFYNIVDNAVKYTTEKPPVITIATGISNKKLWASITDNGPGMSAEVQKNIFDKFYRGSKGDTHDVKGFGLGLSYVKSIADAHGFTIEVKSIQYTGTTFTIRFS